MPLDILKIYDGKKGFKLINKEYFRDHSSSFHLKN